VISICRQYRARQVCTSVDQAQTFDLLQIFILIYIVPKTDNGLSEMEAGRVHILQCRLFIIYVIIPSVNISKLCLLIISSLHIYEIQILANLILVYLIKLSKVGLTSGSGSEYHIAGYFIIKIILEEYLFQFYLSFT
jgi:hypothetical protein